MRERRDELAARLGGRLVDYKLIFSRRLHWQVGRLLTLEDAIGLSGRAPVWIDRIRSIGDQPAAGDEERSQ